MPESPDENPLLTAALAEIKAEKAAWAEERLNYAHKCIGPHTPEEGVEGHPCWCPLGKDHTLAEYWEFDMNRPEDD